MEDQTPATTDEILDIRSTHLTKSQQKELLRLARTAIDLHLQGSRATAWESDDPVLGRYAGVFVTLRQRNRTYGPSDERWLTQPGLLRGCIGRITAERSLYSTVAEMAVEAATCDPRFPPLTVEEFETISIEISVLSPLQAISDIGEVEIGVHGLVFDSGERRVLLLPTVPVTFGWDQVEFAQNLCRKAGLPTDSWRSEASLYTFTTLVISEE